MRFYGYMGKVLHVDLSTGNLTKKSLNPDIARNFIGGMGLGLKILYDDVGPDVDPFSPDNVMVIAAGPLTGTQVPCSSRISVTTKAVNGMVGCTNAGGFWGPNLKWAGYDAVVVRNRSEKPVYIWIDNDLVDIRDAGHIWGKDIWETTGSLKKELKEDRPYQIRVMSIGPAGENLVRYGSIVCDYYHVAARCGAGAVMGSKNLKAIAVRGSKKIPVAQPKKLKEAVAKAKKRIRSNVALSNVGIGETRLSEHQKYGALLGAAKYYEMGCLPGKHYQTADPPNWIETRGVEAIRDHIADASVLEDGCHNCPYRCFHMIEIETGKYAGLRISSGTFVNALYTWGANCAIESYPGIMKCKEVCHRLGIDRGSAAENVAFIMELYQREILSAKDVDGLKLEWGNEDAIIKLLHKIAYRDGFGRVLAEGIEKASEIIGRNSRKYVMAIKGLELMSQDLRHIPIAWSFGFITNPRGGDNILTTHLRTSVAGWESPDQIKVKYGMSREEFSKWYVTSKDMFDDVKKKVYGVPPKVDAFAYEGKAMLVKWLEELSTISNCLGICLLTCDSLGPTYFADLYSCCTGMDTTPQELMTTGERVFNLARSYIAREGITRSDDDYPVRFYEEPISDGAAKGAALSRRRISEMLDEYYELRGWDKKLGIPTRKKLIELGLNKVADEITS